MQVTVNVNTERVTMSLGNFRLGIQQRRELLGILGKGQLASVYKTFDEEGPGWPALALSTIKKYGARAAGHKLLVLHGILRGSIHSEVVSNDTVVIGTNLRYARVQQFGSADYGADLGAAESPLQFLAHVPAYLRRGARMKNRRMEITNIKGRRQVVTKRVEGPVKGVRVGSHGRRQNIPPRPYLVFRSEDPARMLEETQLYIIRCAKAAGLEAS